MFNFKKVTALLVVFSLMMVLSGCGAGSSGDPTSPAAKTSTTVVPESVNVSRSGENVTITYQTAVPVQTGSVVTSGLEFQGSALWSEFHSATTADGLTHTVTMKAPAKASFMIYNNPSDKYDNNGKGIKIN